MIPGIPDRISLLREQMRKKNIHACIIPGSDPHISEYTPECWKYRQWITGFTGSAGTVVVTGKEAGLWTDSRYFIQAEDQLQGSGITLYKEKLKGTPTIREWLVNHLDEGSNIGIDGNVFSASEAFGLINFFSEKGFRVLSDFSPLNEIWEDRPELPSDKIFVFPEQFAGLNPSDKIKKLIQELNENNADLTILSSLDAIAWLFNIRGSDVEFNPVAIWYAVISEKENILFINPEKLTREVVDHLLQNEIIPADYSKIYDYLKNLPAGKRILINPGKINYSLQKAIPGNCIRIHAEVHPVDRMKSIKNETEIEGIQNAMIKDGVALVRFNIWLEDAIRRGSIVTELDVSRKLKEYRSEQEFYFGESFETIAGFAEHGAIIHYGATEASNATIKKDNFLLIDSGAQYFDGTTDITRTIATGEVSDRMKRDYTLVLKGHIALARARFPEGTKGVQLDILARKPLWENGLNYLYGTGHGVGHFLNVHEGPQSIRMEYNPEEMRVGMITSNEPGVYIVNKYGIRIENLILTVKDQTSEAGNFYKFETITLCPIDKNPIDKNLLDKEEIEWLDSYHRTVFDRLSSKLTNEEKIWLENKTNNL